MSVKDHRFSLFLESAILQSPIRYSVWCDVVGFPSKGLINAMHYINGVNVEMQENRLCVGEARNRGHHL